MSTMKERIQRRKERQEMRESKLLAGRALKYVGLPEGQLTTAQEIAVLRKYAAALETLAADLLREYGQDGKDAAFSAVIERKRVIEYIGKLLTSSIRPKRV